MEKGANVQLMLNFTFDIRKLDNTNLCISSKTVNQFYLQVWNIYSIALIEKSLNAKVRSVSW